MSDALECVTHPARPCCRRSPHRVLLGCSLRLLTYVFRSKSSTLVCASHPSLMFLFISFLAFIQVFPSSYFSLLSLEVTLFLSFWRLA